jgi:branched-chain amino acid transport system permease protein
VAIGTVLTLFAMAGLTHMAVFRRLAGQPEFTLVIATLGLAAIIKGATSITWGGEARLMRSPIEDEPLSLAGGINTTTYGIIGIIVAILFLSLALSYFRFSTTGVRMQAAAENPILAALGRIRIDRMYILGWFMALSAATTAGILFSYQTALTYQGLETIGLRGVAPALVGGLTSIKGIVPGAFIVAAAEILGVHWFGGEASHVAAWVVVFIVLMIRPYGLFGSQRVERV